MRRARIAFWLGAACCSCGGTVVQDPGSAGAASGGTGGTGSTGATGGTSGSGGLAGDGGSGAAAGTGGKACFRSEDHFGVKLATSATVQPPACVQSWTGPEKWSATGIVVASSDNAFQIDECSPAADCVPIITDVSMSGRDLALLVPIGAIVRIDYTITSTIYQCARVLSVSNLPSWDGVPNPISPKQELYLAAADGTYQAPEESGLTISLVELGCPPSSNGCGGTSLVPDDYAFSFGTPAGTVQIGMGETLPLGQGLSGANLRSYVSGYCDDYWSWAYWVSRQ